jgi:hypothetical protein
MNTPDPTRVAEHPLRSLRPWVRSRPLRTMFRPREYADLVAISKAWGVPVATALWAIVADQLARYRKQAPELGEHGMAIAAGLTVTRCATDEAVRRGRAGG